MLRNQAGQSLKVYAFTRSTGEPVTGDGANITAKLSLDGGTLTATNDVNPTETEDGYYLFTTTQGETDAETIDIYPESSTSGVQVIGVPGRVTTSTAQSGSGADEVTLTFTKEGGAFIADADVWITSDAEGTDVVAGTLQTDSNGEVTFMLDDGATYYAWLQKDGINSIRGDEFVAQAD